MAPIKYRNQTDSHDSASAASSISFDPSECRTRKEFGPEVDIPTILRRFGAVQFGQLQYGEQQMGVDITDALQLRAQAAAAYETMPPAIKKAFPKWEDFYKALDDGRLSVTDPEPSGGSTPEGSGSAPSDSAAGGAPK